MRKFNQFIVIALCFILCSAFIFQTSNLFAAGEVTQARCNLYMDGNTPTKVRVALDFAGASEKLTLKMERGGSGIKDKGYIQDFIVTPVAGKGGFFGSARIKYGNAGDILKIRMDGSQMFLGIQEKYQLEESKFAYLDKVAYADFKISARKEMPKMTKAAAPAEKPMPVTPMIGDTVFVEKIVRDTIYIEKIVHDTVYVDKVQYKYVDKTEVNMIEGIECKYQSYWWNDPDLKLKVSFSKSPVEFSVSKPRGKLRGLPKGYTAAYLIRPVDRKQTGLFNDVDVDYTGIGDMLQLKADKNVCYILVKSGVTLTPGKFSYDKGAKTSTLKLQMKG